MRRGKPAEALSAFVGELRQTGVGGPIKVLWHDEAGAVEVMEAEAVRRALVQLPGTSCESKWGCSLWHPADLPLTAEGWGLSRPKSRGQPSNSDESYTSQDKWAHISRLTVQSFRRKAAPFKISDPHPEPETLPPPPPYVESGPIPTLRGLLDPCLQAESQLGSSGPSALFGFSPHQVEMVLQAAERASDDRSAFPLRGGEDNAMRRLSLFIEGPAKHVSREGGGGCDIGVDASSKLSAYLSIGCLSPRTVRAAYRREGSGAGWLAEQLEMRDFWIFSALALGSRLFDRDNDGSNPAALPATHWGPFDGSLWHRWASATTGLPLMDASMSEMHCTGYTSNRPRQICVSMLARDLKLDWRLGAELFQWLLVDYEVGANWGNWRYFAGVGCDPKQRYYLSISQGLRYDAQAAFVTRWLPALKGLTAMNAHMIGLPAFRGILPVGAWPKPIIDPMIHLSGADRKLASRRPPARTQLQPTAYPVCSAPFTVSSTPSAAAPLAVSSPSPPPPSTQLSSRAPQVLPRAPQALPRAPQVLPRVPQALPRAPQPSHRPSSHVPLALPPSSQKPEELHAPPHAPPTTSTKLMSPLDAPPLHLPISTLLSTRVDIEHCRS